MTNLAGNLITRDNIKAGYLAVFLVAAVLYIITCAPGPLWQDSGMYQYRIWHNDIEGKLGLALSHPLYHIIGIVVKYIPVGEFAHRVNLISAIAGALAVANIFLLLRLLLDRNLPAIVAAAAFALSWTHWQFATIAEVYTLYSALFLSELLVLYQYIKTRRVAFLYLLAFFNGLAIADHMWAAIAFACYLIFIMTLLIKKQIHLKNFAFILAAWLIGALPYEYLIVKNIIETREPAAVLSSAVFGNSWQTAALNTSVSLSLVKENLILIFYNFATPNILFFFVGLYALKKLTPSRAFKILFVALLILFFVFAFRYTVPDRYAFFIPFYCLSAILIGIGFHTLVVIPRRKVLCWIVLLFTLLPIPIYIATPIVAQKVGFKLPTKRTIPYRNDYVWFLQPWRTGYRGPQRFADEALAQAEKDSIIYADGTTVYPLLYAQQVKGRRQDVTVVSGHGSVDNLKNYDEDVIDGLFAEHAIYVVSPVHRYCPEFLLKRYEFNKAGVLWKAVD